MVEQPPGLIRRVTCGHRLYWLLAILVSPVPMVMAMGVFQIDCRCAYGAATGDAFEAGMYVIWGRLALGLLLGEQRTKAAVYLLSPFLIGLTIVSASAIVWPHAH